MVMIWQVLFVHLLPIAELLDFVQAPDRPGRWFGLGFSTESVQGPMARNVTDCACFLTQCPGLTQVPLFLIRLPGKFPHQGTVKRADTNVRIAYSPDLNGFASLSKEWNRFFGTHFRQLKNLVVQ
ncbi:MAG: hypothetical protein Ct9H300mP28_08480 [Pseudomonadota bacterium]|nr:MAG: hypothetical protein Ct9H300mP28_08480 [Pseudomonadota bacterium]